MENKNEYKEEKKKFKSLVIKLVVTIILINLIIFNCKERDKNKVELVNSFRKNNELICSNKIVSIKNGWNFNVKNERFYKSDDTFPIKLCKIRN